MTNGNAAALLERTTAVLAIALTGAGGLIWGVRGMVGAGAGGLLACLNIFVMTRLAGRAVERARAGDTTGASLFGAGMIAKMMVLVGLCWLAVGVVHLVVPAFALGLSALVLSATGAGLWLALRPVAAVSSQEVL
jgi:hypothetical protein